jgi:endonuclease YncB( thermonuclease family)
MGSLCCAGDPRISDYDALLDETEDDKDTSFNDHTGPMKVVRFIDGDTIVVKFIHNKHMMQWRLRLLGYNSPETRVSKTNPHRDTIKRKAVEDTELLKSLVPPNRMVAGELYEFDSFGRILARIYINGQCINAMMLKDGHAVSYPDTKTKRKLPVLPVQPELQVCPVQPEPQMCPVQPEPQMLAVLAVLSDESGTSDTSDAPNAPDELELAVLAVLAALSDESATSDTSDAPDVPDVPDVPEAPDDSEASDLSASFMVPVTSIPLDDLVRV